jgi:hypothetical protein
VLNLRHLIIKCGSAANEALTGTDMPDIPRSAGSRTARLASGKAADRQIPPIREVLTGGSGSAMT